MRQSDALALFAGLGQGYMNQNNVKRQQAIEQANIDWQNNLRQRDQAAYDQQQAMRKGLIAAAAPTTAVATMQADPSADNRDVGSDPSVTLTPTGGYTVGGAPVADRSAADAALAAYNNPTATMGRMADVMTQSGDPVAAAQMRSQARQEQLGQLQLDAATRQQHADTFNSGLTTAIGQGHQAIADYLTKSGGDGHGGGLKAEVVPSADGKTVRYKLTKPDGTSTLTDPYDAGHGGAIEAGFAYQGQMTPAMLAAHNEAQVKDKREQQLADQTGLYQQGMLKNQADKVGMSLEIAQLRADARAAGAGPKDPFMKMTGADQAAYNDAAKESEALRGKVSAAQIDGTFGAADPSTGAVKYTPGQQAILDRIRALETTKATIAARYSDHGPAAGAGPLGAYPGGGAPASPIKHDPNFRSTAPVVGASQMGQPPAAAPAIDPATIARSEAAARDFARMAPSVVARPGTVAVPAAAGRQLTPEQAAIVNGLPYSMRAAATQRYLAGAAQ